MYIIGISRGITIFVVFNNTDIIKTFVILRRQAFSSQIFLATKIPLADACERE